MSTLQIQKLDRVARAALSLRYAMMVLYNATVALAEGAGNLSGAQPAQDPVQTPQAGAASPPPAGSFGARVGGVQGARVGRQSRK